MFTREAMPVVACAAIAIAFISSLGACTVNWHGNRRHQKSSGPSVLECLYSQTAWNSMPDECRTNGIHG